jgi:chromosomal replication initiator protein
VLAADRPLEDLQGLGRDLIARLQGGLTCSMQAADRETRLGVLRQMAVRQRIALPESVLEAAAECLPGDARQLAGAMHRLVATAAATGHDLDLSLAKGVFEDLCRASVRVVRLADIEKVVCEVFGLTPDILHSETKAKHASQPRMFAMWLARRYTRSGLSEIGAFFGRRSHSTVVSAQKKVDGLMADGATIRLADRMCRVDEAVLKLESQLRTG